MKRLQGQNVLITGASSGFGRGIALACAEAGANVALVARSGQRLREVAAKAEALGVETVVCVTDIGDEVQIRSAIAETKAHLGHINILVNNAGTNIPSRSIHDTSSEEWAQLLEINLTSAFLFTKALLPGMKERRQGTIINLASRAALHPDVNDALYFVARGDGGHAFSATLKEHNLAVRKYQLKRREGYRSTPEKRQ